MKQIQIALLIAIGVLCGSTTAFAQKPGDMDSGYLRHHPVKTSIAFRGGTAYFFLTGKNTLYMVTQAESEVDSMTVYDEFISWLPKIRQPNHSVFLQGRFIDQTKVFTDKELADLQKEAEQKLGVNIKKDDCRIVKLFNYSLEGGPIVLNFNQIIADLQARGYQIIPPDGKNLSAPPAGNQKKSPPVLKDGIWQ